ncbi:MAG: EAL domain-containing protein [Deltaproteobacteria bacterium]|nr:EAL domain-containing protein [Deltaproteobacteria bacterium]
MTNARKNKAELLTELENARKRIVELEAARDIVNPVDSLIKYTALFSGMSDLAYICDNKGNIIYINDVCEKYVGLKPEELIGKPFAPLLDEENLKIATDVYYETLGGECPRFELVFKDTGYHCEYRNVPLRDKSGAIAGVIGIGRDINERKRAEERLRAERDRAQKYLDVANVIFVALDAGQKVTLINRKGCEVLGYGEGEIIGRNWFENFIPERFKKSSNECFHKIFSGLDGLPECSESVILSKTGSEKKILWKNTALRDAEGRICAILSSGDDVTELRRAEDELNIYKNRLEDIVKKRTLELEEANSCLKEEIASRKKVEQDLRKLTKAIEQSANLVCITDVNGVIEYVNPTFERITGWSKDEALGENPRILASGATSKEVYQDLWDTLLSGNTWRGTFKNKGKNGEFFWVSAVISPVTDEEGKITHFLAVHDDITEQKVSREQIQFLAHYDGLTGLTNRSRFIEIISGWIEDKSNHPTGALFLLDIDQFKFISDAYGHGMGDEFLRRVAKLLQITLRYINTRYFNDPARESYLCRLSGDEFALFLPRVGRAESVAVAEQLRKGLESFYQSDVPCHLTVSVGVSLFPEHGRTTTELLTKADAAMYRAKDLGRNRVHFYTPEERDIEQMHSRLKWKENILDAIREDRFEAWYQPILDLNDEQIKHYEVLARMRDKDGGIILPGPFIDIAERFGLVGEISRVIIEKAMRLQADLDSKGKPLAFCVNISGKELGDREFLYFLQSKMHETGADPARIIFEITETASITDLDSALKFVRTLRALGCRISLDDFGIGFTSFLYLKEFHVDYIKIAGSFIKGLDKNLNDQLFVKAITDVAKGMGIKTVAEFVEHQPIVELLKDYGVDYAQGYHIGQPSPYLNRL